MTPMPPRGSAVTIWRLDHARHQSSWDSGVGAAEAGGRWNSKTVHAVYCALDPATAIVEVAVHKGFAALDTVAHVLTSAIIDCKVPLHVVWPQDVPNRNWLHPAPPSAGQQKFGDELLAAHGFVLLPSVVSTHSWNLIFLAGSAGYRIDFQERFALDTRLHPPT